LAGRLSYEEAAADAVAGAEGLWLAADTPLDEHDRADLGPLRGLLERLVPSLEGVPVLISSQVPVGFTRSLAREHSRRGLRFACIPENLRLGAAVEGFLLPERAPVGLAQDADRAALEPLLAPLGWPVEWMSLESAELTKHATNAFLAMSAAFANELARLCASAGADARQVERALRCDTRVGPRAYLAPGAPFSGGTLARDLRFLSELARREAVETPLLDGVLASNDRHLAWLLEIVRLKLVDLESPVVAILGLAYKPSGGALRRSFPLELGRRLSRDGVRLRAHDPSADGRPHLGGLSLCASAREALAGADLALLATHWPQYRSLDAAVFLEAMRRPCVVDPGWFLAEALAGDPRIDYFAAGRGARDPDHSPERGLAR
jgi:UDPglucose 6-dehydrogenase